MNNPKLLPMATDQWSAAANDNLVRVLAILGAAKRESARQGIAPRVACNRVLGVSQAALSDACMKVADRYVAEERDARGKVTKRATRWDRKAQNYNSVLDSIGRSDLRVAGFPELPHTQTDTDARFKSAIIAAVTAHDYMVAAFGKDADAVTVRDGLSFITGMLARVA